MDTRPFQLTVEKLEVALQGANAEVWDQIQPRLRVGGSEPGTDPLPVAGLLQVGVALRDEVG